MAGDILDGPPAGSPFDAFIWTLAILHIPDRARLFAACRTSLTRPGRCTSRISRCRREPTPAERAALRVKAQCPYPPPPDVYPADLRRARFPTVQLEDVTVYWTVFTAARAAQSRADRARLVRVHGDELVDGLEDFMTTMASLYADGVLGGARIVARV